MKNAKGGKGAKLSALCVIAGAALLVGCSSSDDNSSNTATGPAGTVLVQSAVTASDGGTFTTDDNRLSVIIPAGALSADTELTVTTPVATDDPAGNLASAGSAFNITLGSDIVSPIELRFAIEQQPIHPQLAESAYSTEQGWSRSPSNFFRAADNTVISLVSRDGIYQPVFRTLQADAGDEVERGREVFLYESFGNESFFTDAIGLPTLLNGLTPAAAIGAGAQVDITRVPQSIADVLTGNDFAAKSAALEDPAVTRALLKAEAVVGITSTFADDSSDMVTSAGITCALCHAKVTPTEFEIAENELSAFPIGQLQLDGSPNTAMDVGFILSATPFAQTAGAETVTFLQAFGAGRFDARALPDNPLEDNVLNPTSIPPLWNFVDLAEQSYTLNWDGQFISPDEEDNALASRAELVYDLVMHANGAFGTSGSTVPAALSSTPPQEQLDAFLQAEANQPGNDVELQALLDVQAWQRSLISPAPGTFDETLAEEGFRLFNDKADCVRCHVTAEFTGPVRSASIVLEPPRGGLEDGIKTPGLRGIHTVSPFFHDDSAATLMEVMDIYSGRIVPDLTELEKRALVEYLTSL